MLKKKEERNQKGERAGEREREWPRFVLANFLTN